MSAQSSNSASKPASTSEDSRESSGQERVVVQEGSESGSGEQLVSIRRAPSLLAFAITGALLGLLLAAVLTLVDLPAGLLSAGQPVDDYQREYTPMAIFGLLAVICTGMGLALALSIALLLDRHSAKHPKTVRAIATEADHPDQV
ncbi:MAG: hypothetical protein Q4C74_03595 [Rothia sp. (in: high G+C Gram-positive bacteria)]|nr:hypothetical protein [Rothia sp. (in: high G+C Gram-positive bacteria)]